MTNAPPFWGKTARISHVIARLLLQGRFYQVMMQQHDGRAVAGWSVVGGVCGRLVLYVSSTTSQPAKHIRGGGDCVSKKSLHNERSWLRCSSEQRSARGGAAAASATHHHAPALRTLFWLEKKIFNPRPSLCLAPASSSRGPNFVL
jgi:hypothetical protein